MSVGKYSPTVSTSYARNQRWWDENTSGDDGWWDDEGYDSYGYGKDERDRAGYTEMGYLTSYDEDAESYYLYERVSEEWRGVICGKNQTDQYPAKD